MVVVRKNLSRLKGEQVLFDEIRLGAAGARWRD